MKKESFPRSPFAYLRSLIVLLLFLAGAPLALLALGFYPGGSALAQGQVQNERADTPAFQPMAGEHISRSGNVMPGIRTEAISEQPAAENLTPVELGESQPVMAPTRSSFMASWESISGATGYRLDVSTSPSFGNFVSGYENLDVGDTTGRIVGGLTSGATYYYRVRGYNLLGVSGNSAVMSAMTS